ncbi:MAG: hypothetical protein ACREBU_17185, partial [Nitrososphaera sp.]
VGSFDSYTVPVLEAVTFWDDPSENVAVAVSWTVSPTLVRVVVGAVIAMDVGKGRIEGGGRVVAPACGGALSTNT